MKFVKRLLLLSLCVIMCFNLTGCNITDWYESLQREEKTQNVFDTIADDNCFAMSKETKESQNNWLDTTQSFADATADYEAACAGWWPWHPFKEKKMENAKAKMKKAETSYEKAKSTDKVFQQAKKDAEEHDSKELQTTLDKYLPYIVVVIVLIVVLIVISKLKKKPAALVTQEVTPTVMEDVNRTGQLSVDYEGLLKHNCDKVGLNFDEVLQDYGGDARRAYESTNLLIVKGQSSDEIAASIKRQRGI